MRPVDQVAELVSDAFQPLLGKLGFRVVHQTKRKDRLEIRYAGTTAGVIVSWEMREPYLFVRICRLDNGELRVTAGEVRPDTVLNCFDLNDLVQLVAPEDVVAGYSRDIPAPSAGLAGIVHRQARNLLLHGQSMLAGDFSMVPALDRVVKARARQAAIEKWGERAREFGWQID
jgi:hypothetical protein